jgi:hypothetical protein
VPIAKEEVDALLTKAFSFDERPRPVSADGRPLWRVPYVLLLIRACRQQVATFEQLHVLNWALRSSRGVEQLASYLSGEISLEEPAVRYEPALDRAVALGRGLGLLTFQAKHWALTKEGSDALERIEDDDQLYKRERKFLAVLDRPLSQAAVQRLLTRSQRAK